MRIGVTLPHLPHLHYDLIFVQFFGYMLKHMCTTSKCTTRHAVYVPIQTNPATLSPLLPLLFPHCYHYEIPTVLASFALHSIHSGRIQLLSSSASIKCLPASCIPIHSNVLHNSHTEVITFYYPTLSAIPTPSSVTCNTCSKTIALQRFWSSLSILRRIV